MSKDQVIVIRGELNWAKLVGPARPHTGNPKYDKGPYWSVDITPTAKSLAIIKAAGIADKLREPNDKDSRTEKFLTLRILETNDKAKNGKNDPPAIVDITGKDWGQERLLGNGTIADIKVKVKDYGSASAKGVYYQKARILDHKPYEGGGFDEIDEDDEFFAKKEEAINGPSEAGAKEVVENEDLEDDDVPF